jgi:CubicO group peptidase (beta-lactamase class C family)
VTKTVTACPARPSFGQDVWVSLGQGRNPYADLDEAAVLDALAGERLRRTPGTGRGSYSNFGAGLLGIALRRAVGVDSYADLVSRTVLRPLGLVDAADLRTGLDA